MTDDLISRQAVLELPRKITRNFFGEIVDESVDIKKIEALPPAQPERKKGKWVKVGHFGRTYKCNRCGNYLDFDGVNAGRGDANYCPNCGADMREEN